MHIQLDKENSDKMLRASNRLGKSPNALVNAIIASLDEVHVTEELQLHFKPGSDPERKKILRRDNWVMKY